MWNYICPNLLKAIDIEPEQSVLPEHLHSLSKVRLNKLQQNCWCFMLHEKMGVNNLKQNIDSC